jgi:8-oxo-dGTP pyrophosphatase MutT (NUDIX family)
MSDVVRGVAAIVFNDKKDKVLLLQRSVGAPHSPGVWENTGGHAEAGEDSLTAIAREAMEELGIQLTEVQHLYQKTWFAEHKQKTYEMQIYTAQTNDQPILNEPLIFQAFQWFSKDELKQLEALANYACPDFVELGWL